MITPVDFRQKSFRTGIGYDKKDVDSFMVELLRNYEELYRSNAQQIAEIKDLSDNLIRYQAMEESLNRELMVAEKTSEEMIAEANDKAKKIEAEAKTKAKALLKTAKEDLAFTHQQTIAMAQMYASMKAQLNMLFKSYVDMTNSDDMSIDIDALDAFGAVPEDVKESINACEIVPEMNFAASAFTPKMTMAASSGGGGTAFGSFDGDPQMRDESPLGGMGDGGATVEGQRGDVSTAGFGFTSLSQNESYRDPFEGIQVESTNQFDDNKMDPFANTAKQTKTTARKTKKTTTPPPKAQPEYDAPAYDAPQYDAPQYDAPQYDAPAYDTADYNTAAYETAQAEPQMDTAAGAEYDYAQPAYDTEDIPVVDYAADTGYEDLDSSAADDESVALEGEVDERPKGPRMIGDGEEANQDFEFL